MPSLTIIIAALPSKTPPTSLLFFQEHFSQNVEVIVARGTNPSSQRNHAAESASGDILLFWDDDVKPSESYFKKILSHFNDPKIVSVGGPAVRPQLLSIKRKAIAQAMENFWLTGPSSIRYKKVGAVRQVGQSGLILCNQAFRREAFLDIGGFNEELYPNEENELMDRLEDLGYFFIYDPELWVERPPRSSISGFVKMLSNYGRGRSEQTRLKKPSGWWKNYLPLAYVGISIVSFFALIGFSFLSKTMDWEEGEVFFNIGFWAWKTGNILPGILAAVSGKNPLLIFLVPLGHWSYACGLVWGLFSKRRKPLLEEDVSLEIF